MVGGALLGAVAGALGFTYLDTGAMYRAVALAALRGHGLPHLAEVSFADDGHVLLEGEDVEALIRTPEVSEQASRVAAGTYQVDPALAGRRVELVFSPFDLQTVEVRAAAPAAQ